MAEADFKVANGIKVDDVQIAVSGDAVIDTATGALTLSSASGTVVVDDNLVVTGSLTATVTGNADTASELETARTISLGGDLSGSASFDGSADITITANVQPDSVALGTDTTGNYVNDVVAGTGVTVTHTPGEGSSASIAIGQDVSTTASVTFAHVSGDVTGDLTGNADTATALETARAISLGGDLSGSVSFDGTADVTITATIKQDSVALGTDTTGNYVADVTGGTGVTVTHTPGEGSSPSVAIGQDVATSASVQFAQVTTTGPVVIGGDLTVNGTTTTLNTETLEVEDNIVVLNSNVSGSPVLNAGIEIERGTANNVSLRWNETSDRWEITEDGIEYKDIATEDYVDAQSINSLDEIGDVSISSASAGQFLKWTGSAWVNDAIDLGSDTVGNYVADVSGGTGVTVTHTPGEGSTPSIAIGQAVGTSSSVTFAAVTAPLMGNASTASALQTARSISLGGDLSGSASFNGTADVTITATVQPDSVALGTDTTGNYMVEVTGGTGVTISHTPGEGSTASVAIGQDVATTASVSFAAVTAPLVGNASTASALETARAISLGGDLSGSVSFDGSQNVTISATIQPDSVALGTDTTGNYVSDVAGGTGITVTHTPGEGSSASVSLNATLNDLSNVDAASPSDGQFLKYSTTSSTWVPAAIPTINSLDDIGDVTASAPSDGQVLTYVSASSAWVAADAAGGSEQTNTSITTNSATTIASFDKDAANAAEFTVKIEQEEGLTANKVLVLHNGTEANFTKYGEMYFNKLSPVPGTGASSWVTQSPNIGGYSDIRTISYGDGIWVAGTYNGLLRTSTDTVSWATTTSNFGNTGIFSSDYGNGLWILGGQSGQMRKSTDAITWTTQVSTFSTNSILSLKFSNNIWIAAGNNGQIRTSTDGTTWTTRTSNFGNTAITSVAYGNNLWVAVGFTGQIRTSTDAITWTTQTSNFGNTNINSVAYGNGLWVAAGYSGQLRTSTDGTTWTTETSNFGVSRINVVAYGNSLWLAAGHNGAVRTSTDATTWVTQDAFLPDSNGGIVYSAEFGKFDWVIGAAESRLRSSSADSQSGIIPLSFAVDISGQDVRLRATITDAETYPATAKVLKTLVEE